MTLRTRHPGWLAAALMALLMLAYASARSAVMQVAMAAPASGMPMCDGGASMGSMAMGARVHASSSSIQKPAHGSPKTCPYCDAAAHPPLLDQPAPLLSATSVRFVAYRLACLHGPRGPPARRPRARDPPVRRLSL